MDWDDIIGIAIFAFFLLRWILKSKSARQKEVPEALDEQGLSGEEFEELGDPLDLLQNLEDRAAQSMAQGKELLRRHPQGKREQAILNAVREFIVPQLQDLASSLQRSRAELEALDNQGRPHRVDPASFREAEEFIQWSTMALDVSQEALNVEKQQQGPASAYGQAEVLGTIILKHIQEHLAPSADHMGGYPVAVALPAHVPLMVMRVLAPGGMAPVRVSRRFLSSVWEWALLGGDVALDLVLRVPTLKGEVDQLLRQPPPGTTPVARQFRPLMARWSERFFADVLATVALGSGYVRGLAVALATPQNPARAGIVQREGSQANSLGTLPPPHLRMRVVTDTLKDLGLVEEGERLWIQWARLHERLDAVLLTLQDGRTVRLPVEFALQGMVGFARDMVRQSWGSLSNRSMGLASGLTYTPEMEREAEWLAEEYLLDRSPMAPVQVVLGAATLVVERGDVHQQMVLNQVKASLGGEFRQRAAPQKVRPRPEIREDVAIPEDQRALQEVFKAMEERARSLRREGEDRRDAPKARQAEVVSRGIRRRGVGTGRAVTEGKRMSRDSRYRASSGAAPIGAIYQDQEPLMGDHGAPGEAGTLPLGDLASWAAALAIGDALIHPRFKNRNNPFKPKGSSLGR